MILSFFFHSFFSFLYCFEKCYLSNYTEIRQVYLYVCVLVAQSCLSLCNSMTIALQAPLSMQFSGQEYWSGLPFPALGGFPDPGMGLGLSHCMQTLFAI